ncbi:MULTISPECIES: carbon-nitrogen hydrolase family protein [Chryseobacterium]|uniref:Amidohydrolase n=1 Tax=Chryseobacterium camelliae TaxID=1265445 RepID=A0ABU0TKN5_9FLAO|nr:MULTISPECIES: carbon-nitrogen hydrolase family protein [Chryseobacterium]MDT3408543.1 putative amidohydrolase [Pseudacidovorax intermedius]MDQ1097602.1 putative amidohydrolase [Chryseobacterium camelliae]MDQ1101531.1 putative amidohydrolase [Chryseobacterium sp. SORGH_AS_1048]MDR6084974.1 putative amidohydrolase [Chryseobacterium sp. SORGH_AS_0909]MDR6129327.1 putative amidohydrolase [Chryseobacterium sp. SORGH_AS_1175]
MKIAAAQIRPISGNIPENIHLHTQCINQAIAHQADAIFFPELSLTGYEPELAKELASDQNDTRLDCFQEISTRNNIIIGLGLPTRSNRGIMISMILFQPAIPRQTYSKQQLHADEFPYFIHGENQILLTINDEKIAPGICYETMQHSHAEHAYQMGMNIYVACVAKSQNGIDKALIHYPEVAKKFSVPVLMSNCIGPCDSFESAGQTSVWTQHGHIAGQLDEKAEGILIFDTETEKAVAVSLQKF